MSDDTAAAPRANCNGHPCPPWCVTDHEELLVPCDPSFGYQLTHVSGPMRAGLGFITLLQPGAPDWGTEVHVSMQHAKPSLRVSLSLSPQQAGQLAPFLGAHGQPGLAAQVRAAAELALEAGR